KSRHLVLYWTTQARESGWVAAEYETFFDQCYVTSKGARRLVILSDGQEPISSLPSLLQSLQIAYSASELTLSLRDVTAGEVDAVHPTLGDKGDKIESRPLMFALLVALTSIVIASVGCLALHR